MLWELEVMHVKSLHVVNPKQMKAIITNINILYDF